MYFLAGHDFMPKCRDFFTECIVQEISHKVQEVHFYHNWNDIQNHPEKSDFFLRYALE